MTSSLANLPALEQIKAAKARRGLSRADLEIAPTWFHPKQFEAWKVACFITAICAGWQSGKTVILLPWLLREMQRKGTGDYGAFSSTYKLMTRKFLPILRTELERKEPWGQYAEFRAADMLFKWTENGARRLWGSDWDEKPTTLYLGYAENPESLESSTLKGVVWDEPGQGSIPQESFNTVHSRLMANRGRMCLASRPYEFGWYQKLVEAGLRGDPDVKVINFASWDNPVNPNEEDEYFKKLERELPAWKYDMYYKGVFTRPAGAIFDCFDDVENVCKRFAIPKEWDILVGVDFGLINVAAVFLAEEKLLVSGTVENGRWGDPTGRYFVFATYHEGGKDGKDHALEIMNICKRVPRAFGGSHTEQGARESFNFHRLHVREPLENSVEVGVSMVYGGIKSRQLVVFSDLEKLIHDIHVYSQEGDDEGGFTEKIKDKKKYHRLDALRYVCTAIFRHFVPMAPQRRFRKQEEDGLFKVMGRLH